MRKAPTSALALLLALVVAGCSDGASTAADTPAGQAMSTSAAPADGSAPSAGASQSQQPADTPPATTGAWIDAATFESDPAAYHGSGDVVLFFNASWCPTCRETVRNLDADGVPAGLTVVSVDYDTSTALKKQYGVTVQHTFVQVSPSGESLAKFTGSLTGEDIAARVA